MGMLIIRLYKQYQTKLKNSLDTKNTNIDNEQEILSPIITGLRSNYSWKKIHSMKLAEKIEPIILDLELETLINDASPVVRKHALQQIFDLKITNAFQLLNQRIAKEDHPELLVLLTKATESLQISQEQSITYEFIENLIRSKYPEKRKYAAQLIQQIQTDQSLALLLELIRDIEPEVRLEAIKAATKMNRPELWPFLTDNLSSKHYKRAATTALIAIGAPVLDNLESSFYKSSSTITELIQIIRIMSTIGGEKATGLLLNKLTYPDSKIVKEVLYALKKCNYKANEEYFGKILLAIETTISILTWNMAAVTEVNSDSEKLIQSIKEEDNNNYDMLFLLMSILYDPSSIEKVKTNLQNGSTENIGYAIELLDIFIAEEIKTILFPLFDDKPINEKLRLLQVHFPREKYS